MFYKGSMQYTKQAMDFDCQLHILKERGLTVENEEDALKFLHSVSYFRFANYLQPMEQSTESHQFLPNSSFTFATKLYVFKTENVAFGLLNAIKRTFFISICCSIFARVGEKDKKMVLNGKVK